MVENGHYTLKYNVESILRILLCVCPSLMWLIYQDMDAVKRIVGLFNKSTRTLRAASIINKNETYNRSVRVQVRTIWDYLALSGTIWHYMALYRTIWDYLALSGTICHYLTLPGTI